MRILRSKVVTLNPTMRPSLPLFQKKLSWMLQRMWILKVQRWTPKVKVERLIFKKLHQRLLCLYRHLHPNSTLYRHLESMPILHHQLFRKVYIYIYFVVVVKRSFTLNNFIIIDINSFFYFANTYSGTRWFDSIVSSSTQSSNPYWTCSTNNCTGCWECIFQTTSVYSTTDSSSVSWSVGNRKFLLSAGFGIRFSGSTKQYNGSSKFGSTTCSPNWGKGIKIW